MSRPDRHPNRRTLGFENLEAKKSPTSLVGLNAPIDSTSGDIAEFSAMEVTSPSAISDSVQSEKADLLLSYVAAMESVDTERALPTQADASAVDHWLATNAPPKVTGR